MASDARRERRLVGWRMAVIVWLPVVAISAAHFLTPPDSPWVHDVLRRLYYLPILFGAFAAGLRGGLAAVAVVVALYYPHAFVTAHHFDPAGGLEKALEIVLYLVVGGVAGWLTDQERKRRAELERALEDQRVLRDQLVRAGRLGALGEVVAGIAHEIKNPLHALAGTAEAIETVIPAEGDERRLWDLHQAEILRLRRTAERFLSFARPEASERVPVDLRDVASRLVELVDAHARRQGVAVEARLPDRAVMVLGDRDQLAQVGLNIAVNAVEAIGGRGGRLRISVETGRRGSSAVATLVLENDGPPIPEGDIERLFDPFHSGRPDGTGLGLSISARIAELHEGTIDASNEGLGVRFRVVLPAA
jgi:signal transduction histidine kinase